MAGFERCAVGSPPGYRSKWNNRPRRLVSLLALDQTTVSRSLATVRQRRWVRTARGDDRRERRVSLTEAGKLQLQRANRAWRRAQARFRRLYGAKKWDAMQRELTAIAAAIPMMSKT